MNFRGVSIKVATIVALMVVGSLAYAKKMPALVKSVDGWVEFALPGSEEFRPLRPSMKLPHGTTVKTSQGANAIVRVVPGAAMEIAENTTVVIDGMEFEKEGEKVMKRKARIQLSEGTVSALLDHRDPKATDFRIETPQGSAAARGTFYGVSVVDGQTYVSVQKGKVGIQEKEASKEDASKKAE